MAGGGSAVAATPPSTPQEGVTVYGRHVPFHDPRFKPAPTQPLPVAPDAEMKRAHDAVTGAQLGAFGDAYQNSGPLPSINPVNGAPVAPVDPARQP